MIHKNFKKTTVAVATALGLGLAGTAHAVTVSESFQDDADFINNFDGNVLAEAEARYGDGGGPADWEIGVLSDGNQQPDDQGNVNLDGSFGFSLSFAPTDGDLTTMTLTVFGESPDEPSGFEESVFADYDLSAAGDILLRTRAGEQDLMLNIMGDEERVRVTESGGVDYLALSGMDFAEGGEIGGSMSGFFDGNGSVPAMQAKITDSVAEVPAPGALALFGAGLFGLGVIARRRRNA